MSTVIPADLFAYVVQDLARLLSREFELQANDLNITRSQARVLASVERDPGATQTELATSMGVQKIALSKWVDTLEQKNLLERRLDSADRRIRRIYLVPGSKPVLDEIWQTLEQVSETALAGLSETKRQALINSLIAVREVLLSD